MVVNADVPDHVKAQAEREGLLAEAVAEPPEKYFGTICGIDMASSPRRRLQVKRGQFYIDW